MLTHRPAADVEDLSTAAALMSAAWQADAPHVAETPAAIEWWYTLTYPDPLADHLRLWFDDGRPVAWTWHEPPELECHVWTGDAETDAEVFGAIIHAVDRGAPAMPSWRRSPRMTTPSRSMSSADVASSRPGAA